MDKREWMELLGKQRDDVETELEWRLFQAQRCRATLLRDREENGHTDEDLVAIYSVDVEDARLALAALYERGTR